MAPAQGAAPAARPSYSSKCRAEFAATGGSFVREEDIAEAKARAAQRLREYKEAARIREEEQQVEQALKVVARRIEKASRYRKRNEAHVTRRIAYKVAREEATMAAMNHMVTTAALKEDKFAAARNQRLHLTPTKPAWKPPGMRYLRQDQSDDEVLPRNEVQWRARPHLSRSGDRKREEDRIRAMTWAMSPPGPKPLEWRTGDVPREQRVCDDRALEQLIKTRCLPDGIHPDGTMFSKDDHRLRMLLGTSLRDEVSSNVSRDDRILQQLFEVSSDLSGDDRCLRQLLEAKQIMKAGSFARDPQAVLDDEALSLLTQWRSALEVMGGSCALDSSAFDDKLLCDLVQHGPHSMEGDAQLESDIQVLQHLLQGSRTTPAETQAEADTQVLQQLMLGLWTTPAETQAGADTQPLQQLILGSATQA